MILDYHTDQKEQIDDTTQLSHHMDVIEKITVRPQGEYILIHRTDALQKCGHAADSQADRFIYMIDFLVSFYKSRLKKTEYIQKRIVCQMINTLQNTQNDTVPLTKLATIKKALKGQHDNI